MNKYKKLSIPYVAWMILFTGIPLLLMLLFAFSTVKAFTVSTFQISDYSFDFGNVKFLTESYFLKSFVRSLKYALLATIFTFLIGYPTAYFISRLKFKNKNIFLLIFIMPMWTNMLVRIRTSNMLLNNYFSSNISFKIVLVMTIVYLPFMIFPIFTVLEKLDKSYLEASNDLGAGKIKTFFKITLPLSSKGIFSGVNMVFLPAAMGFTIPEIVSDGNTNYTMVGQIIERQFKGSTTFYNKGSMWSLIILLFVLGSLYLVSKIDEDGETLL